MALSWPNLPCALKAAIGIGKQTLGTPRQSGAPQGPQPYRERPDTLNEAKAAFPASLPRAGRGGKASVASAFVRRSRRDILALTMPVDDPSLP